MKAFRPFCSLYRPFPPHCYLIALPLYSPVSSLSFPSLSSLIPSPLPNFVSFFFQNHIFTVTLLWNHAMISSSYQEGKQLSITFPSKSASLGVCSVVSSQLSASASRDPIVPPTIRVPPASCLFELRREVKKNLLALSSVQLEHTSPHVGMDENQVHTSLEHLQKPLTHPALPLSYTHRRRSSPEDCELLQRVVKKGTTTELKKPGQSSFYDPFWFLYLLSTSSLLICQIFSFLFY